MARRSEAEESKSKARGQTRTPQLPNAWLILRAYPLRPASTINTTFQTLQSLSTPKAYAHQNLSSTYLPYLSRSRTTLLPDPLNLPPRPPSIRSKSLLHLRRPLFRPLDPTMSMQRVFQIRTRRLSAVLAARRPELRQEELLAMPDLRLPLSARAHGVGASNIFEIDAAWVDGVDTAACDVLVRIRC